MNQAISRGLSNRDLLGLGVVTRAELIQGGRLIDVSSRARSFGFKVPVAITPAVWSECVEWNDEDNQRQGLQDQDNRLWEVLWMCHVEARRRHRFDLFAFQLVLVPRDGKSFQRSKMTLKAVIGPGDNAEQVITILLPSEEA